MMVYNLQTQLFNANFRHFPSPVFSVHYSHLGECSLILDRNNLSSLAFLACSGDASFSDSLTSIASSTFWWMGCWYLVTLLQRRRGGEGVKRSMTSVSTMLGQLRFWFVMPCGDSVVSESSWSWRSISLGADLFPRFFGFDLRFRFFSSSFLSKNSAIFSGQALRRWKTKLAEINISPLQDLSYLYREGLERWNSKF